MRIIGDTNIPFLSYRKICIGGSLLVIVVGLLVTALGPGLNMGIDFVGGTQVTVKFRDTPDLDKLRSALDKLAVGSPSLQRFDEAEKNEILIRVQNPKGAEGDFTKPILDLLKAEFNGAIGSAFDLNLQGRQELTDRLAAADPDRIGADLDSRREHYAAAADAVLAYRKDKGIFTAMDELAKIPELSDAVRSQLSSGAALGGFALLGAESVGPTVGKDLRDKATLAIFFSLLGMGAYIWLRFQLPYGIGAVVALFHDVLITIAALAITGREINLPTVAAILTLVGYSVNDTVVVFDRVRENLRLRRGEPLEQLMNASINQTLSRTLITSGTTLMVVITLYLFGGDVINTFAFVLLVGIIVGTYSSIFIASPVALWINTMLAARRADKRAAGKRR